MVRHILCFSAVLAMVLVAGLNVSPTYADGCANCSQCTSGDCGCADCAASEAGLRPGACKRDARGECRDCCAHGDGYVGDLFYNFYTPASCCSGHAAQLYVAPLPVPPHVGHTYYTYQPFLPHELMYQHSRTYNRYYDGGLGRSRTHVTWR